MHGCGVIRLVFKQIVKGLAGVIRALTALAGSFLFDHHSDGIKRAVVPLIFGRDSGRNRLGAFEATGRVEVLTLLAGMQRKPALRAVPNRVG
jgi:hypothetical protein